MIPLGRWLDHLRAWLTMAQRGEDPEGAHQVRVATRRLDAWLRLQRTRVLRDDLRWLRARCEPVRDLDVVLTHELPEEVRAFFVARRESEQATLRSTLHDPRVEGIVDAISAMPPVSVDRARREIPKIIAMVLKRGGAVDEASADTEALHDLRRALRRLRFSLDWLGQETGQLTKLQDAFGELNDRAVLMRWLDDVPEPESIAAWRAELLEQRDRKRIGAVQTWRQAEPDVERWLADWKA